MNLSKYDIKRKIILPKKITEDLAYICGVIAGDGSINYRIKKKEYSLKIVGNPKDEKEFYNKIISLKFEKIFGVFPHIKYHDNNTTYGFSIYSKTICTYLTEIIELPSGVKYPNLKIPKVFYEKEELLIAFIRGVFDTDGCISFKKKYKSEPYYPVISLASKSKFFIREIAEVLKFLNFKIVEIYDYIISDHRIKQGFTIINKIEINGHINLDLWLKKIDFYSPKHLEKIKSIKS